MPLRHSARRASTDTASAGKKVPTTVTSAEREHRALHDALGTDGDRVGAAHWPPRLRPLVKGGSGSGVVGRALWPQTPTVWAVQPIIPDSDECEALTRPR